MFLRTDPISLFFRLDKLKVLMDDSDFATSHPIVRSLIENGEVTSTANGGGPGKQGTGAGGVGISRYNRFTGFSTVWLKASDYETILFGYI